MKLSWPSPDETHDLLQSGTTVVLAVDLDGSDPPGLRGTPVPRPLGELLSASERGAAARMHTEMLQRRTSRRLAWRRLLLAGLLNVAPTDIGFGREACTSCGGPHGRPFIDHPSNTAINFSASSSAHLSVLALRTNNRVGVDVELDLGTLMPSDEAWLSRAEQRAMTRTTDLDRERLRAWVQKEACVKATGEGLNVDLTEVSVLATAPIHAGLTLKELPLPVPALGFVAGTSIDQVAFTINFDAAHALKPTQPC